MFKGELIFKDADPVYTQTFFRPFDSVGVTFLVDLMQMEGSFSILSIAIEHRDHDELSWTSAGTFTLSDPLVPGIYTKQVGPVKEMLRLKFTQSSGDWMRLLVYPPAWQ